jgi:hypothetical protein
MFLIRWRKRLLACALLCLMALVLLVSTQHRLRLAVIKIIPPSPSALNAAPSQLQHFRFYPVGAHAAAASFSDAMQLFEKYTLAYAPVEAYALAMNENPDSCVIAVREHRPVHCYNVDIAYTQFFGASGFYARMWDLNGTGGLGGFGHNMLELWDEASHKWKAVDPYYHCYYTRHDSAISVSELRQALLTNDTSLHVFSYFERDSIYDSSKRAFVHPIYRAPNELLGELRMLAPSAMVHVNNDFATRFAHRYGAFQFLASFFDKLPMRYRRGLRSAMMGRADARYMIQDKYTPTYGAAAVYSSARALLALAACFAILSLVGFVRSRRAPVVVLHQREQPSVLA